MGEVVGPSVTNVQKRSCMTQSCECECMWNDSRRSGSGRRREDESEGEERRWKLNEKVKSESEKVKSVLCCGSGGQKGRVDRFSKTLLVLCPSWRSGRVRMVVGRRDSEARAMRKEASSSKSHESRPATILLFCPLLHPTLSSGPFAAFFFSLLFLD